ncbi:unnamed protein product [Zymoseptoria tritici ST99CH_1A5]|uniref:Uncharacterized protein n=1 Tax=Zymoseptoria tritici ST99CH_1A5 TaxID=1276529 RepID=A0A1Y6M3F1_ZYMTR|nr:unnamed protein product [Zymoseptoria tritici ST99CH_1A5]
MSAEDNSPIDNGIDQLADKMGGPLNDGTTEAARPPSTDQADSTDGDPRKERHKQRRTYSTVGLDIRSGCWGHDRRAQWRADVEIRSERARWRDGRGHAVKNTDAET